MLVSIAIRLKQCLSSINISSLVYRVAYTNYSLSRRPKQQRVLPLSNSLKEENRQKITQNASGAVSKAFNVSGMFVGKIANNTLKKAQEGFQSEFNK
jgi:hypothetical protein